MDMLFKHSNKNVVVAFVLGIIFAVFVGHAYTVYQLRALVFQHDVVLRQIVEMINLADQAAQGGSPQGFEMGGGDF